MATFSLTDIYGITDSVNNLGRSNVEQVKEMLKAGIKIIQYREKKLSAEAFLEECHQIRLLTRDAGCCFIVNDRVDLALLCEADGVHVGQNDMALEHVRQFVGPTRLIGVSTHSHDEVQSAMAGGADYIGVGPIFPTDTKKDATPVGLEYLAEVSRTCPLPQVAIGGINETNIADVAAHGGKCAAMVTAITMAKDIPAKVALLRKLMHGEKS